MLIRGRVGTGVMSPGDYNEFKAINEILHEVRHAIQRQRYVQKNGSLDGYENTIGVNRYDPRYAREEVLVETAAQERMISIAEPRIAAAEQAGNSAEATRLRDLLADAIEESNDYISYWSRRTGN